MLPFLMLVPVVTSFLLGMAYLVTKHGRPWIKIIGVSVFALAVYLQFFSRFALTGMLVQVGLALTLSVWRKVKVGA